MDGYERTKGFSEATPSCSLVSGQGDPPSPPTPGEELGREVYFINVIMALSDNTTRIQVVGTRG